MRSDRYCDIRGGLFGVACGVVGFSDASSETDLAHRRLTPDFTFLHFSSGGMHCVSYDKCVYHLCGLCFFPGVLLHSEVTGACPVTADLMLRVNVRPTTYIRQTFRLSYICMKEIGSQRTYVPGPHCIMHSWARVSAALFIN